MNVQETGSHATAPVPDGAPGNRVNIQETGSHATAPSRILRPSRTAPSKHVTTRPLAPRNPALSRNLRLSLIAIKDSYQGPAGPASLNLRLSLIAIKDSYQGQA